MNRAVAFVLPLFLAGTPVSAQDEVPAEGAEAAESGPITRQTAVRESPLLDFEYSWPQAIAGETKLVAELSSDLAKSYDQALKDARENKTMVEQANATFNQNMFTRVWSLEGQTERLVSLVASTDTFTGGAHPNHTSSALLWDRPGQRQVQFADLFDSAEGLSGAVRTQYCKLLDAERASRRGGEVLDGDFAACPPLAELTVFPADSDGNGRFDTVQLIADPYVAGPYSEGDYTVSVKVSPALVAALKPEYRPAFEVQRAQ